MRRAFETVAMDRLRRIGEACLLYLLRVQAVHFHCISIARSLALVHPCLHGYHSYL